jgi:hypothetical protein
MRVTLDTYSAGGARPDRSALPAPLRIASRTSAFALLAPRIQKIKTAVAAVTQRSVPSWGLSDLVHSCVQELNE